MFPAFWLMSGTRADGLVRIFNTHDLADTLWVMLPEQYRYLTVVSVSTGDTEISGWDRDELEIWVQVPIEALDKSEGYHEYRIHLVDAIADWETELKFAYIIQTDSPDKPYYYMGKFRGKE